METLRNFLKVYFRPGAAFGSLIDEGSWFVAGLIVLVVALAFQFGVNRQIADSYSVGSMDQFIRGERVVPRGEMFAGEPDIERALSLKPFPVFGHRVTWLFSFDSSFISPLIILSVFFVPGTLLLSALIARLGNAGVVLNKEYGSFSTCALTAWAAAHLPFALAGLALGGSGELSLALWLSSGAVFALLLVIALRTALGLEYTEAVIVTALSWIPYSIGVNVLEFVSPWFFSPFLLIYAVMFFGGYLKGGVAGISSTMRQKRDHKRHLQSATVNPNDADAHVQLGLIYLSRRQSERAKEHFLKAYGIDNEEIDANYELGVIARKEGELQKAIGYFSTVVGQNDTFRLSEIWREIGITYLEAGMKEEAREALEKYVSRRPFDGEGLFYLGKLLKELDDRSSAREMFERAVEAAATAPYHRRRELRKWAKRSKREL